jgi:Flp pilus assembly protein TadG
MIAFYNGRGGGGALPFALPILPLLSLVGDSSSC